MHEDNEHHHGHHHEHNDEKDQAELSLEKIKTLIQYLLKHNNDHITDLGKWHTQASESGLDDAASEFRKIIKLSKKIERHFNSALKKIEKHG